MKNFVFLLFLFFSSSALFTQKSLLVVHYDYALNLPKEAMDKIASLGPNALLSNMIPLKSCLYYSDKRSNYFALPLDTIMGGVPVRSNKSKDVHFFKDHTNKRLHRTNLSLSSETGTDESLRELNNWQLRPDLPTKTILGYKCSAASLMEKSGEVIAWYAPELPFPDGPMHYGMLPGLILEMEKKSYRCVATKMEVLEESPPQDLNYRPQKVVSLEEFNRDASPARPRN